MNDLDLDGLIARVETRLAVTGGVEKQASEKQASDSLEELLLKATSQTEFKNGDTPEMNKQAQEQGIALANAIIDTLVKQANSVVAEADAKVADDDAKIRPNPIEGQTATQVLENHILAAIQEGAANVDAVCASNAPSQAAVEGAAQDSQPAVPAGGVLPTMGVYGDAMIGSDEVEKVAALEHLVGQGVDFDSAVALVKQAEEAIFAEQVEMAKLAATQTLIKEAGVSLDDAVALVNFGLDKIANEEEESHLARNLALGAAGVGAVGGAGYYGSGVVERARAAAAKNNDFSANYSRQIKNQAFNPADAMTTRQAIPHVLRGDFADARQAVGAAGASALDAVKNPGRTARAAGAAISDAASSAAGAPGRALLAARLRSKLMKG